METSRLIELFDVMISNFTRLVDFCMGMMFGVGFYLLLEKIRVISALASYYGGTN